MRLGLILVEFTAHWSFPFSPSSAQMVRVLAILLSLICLNAQSPQYADKISNPHDAMSATAALGQVCEHVQQNYPPEGEGRYKGIISIYKELAEELKELFRSLQVARTTPASRPLEKVDIEMGHVQSQFDECLKKSEPGGSTTKFCGKVFEAFGTALGKFEHEIPVLSTIRANCPPMKAILAGQVVTLLYTVCFQDSFQQTDSLFGAFFQVGVNAMIGGLATDFIWCDAVEPMLNKIQSRQGAKTIPRA